MDEPADAFEQGLAYCVFSKHLQGVPLEETAERLRAIGIGALDLTVRPGGHVEPERAEDELPRTVERLRRHGVRVAMITTLINEASAANAKVLAAAARAGIRHYKLGCFAYGGFGTLERQRAEVAAKLKDVAALNRDLGLYGGYHNHSDTFFGAVLADVHAVLRDLPPEHLGLYFDPTHAVVEGGSSGWRMGLDLLAGRVGMLAVKDFRWADGKHRYAGGRTQSVEFTTLELGNTPWPEVLLRLKQTGFRGPVSFHSEYVGTHSFREMDAAELVAQTARDLAQFRAWVRALPAGPA